MTAWQAHLHLDYRYDAGRTVVVRSHRGPLQVQKALYPEGTQLAHTLIVHPPGGIAGGDALAVEVAVRPRAQALITTPGAAKWYKAAGRTATQTIALEVAGGLEWLPQEAIVFDRADARSTIEIGLHEDAATIGWDLVALGRAASGETFGAGCYAQTVRLHDGGRLQWVERTRLAGGDALLDSPIGLAARRAFGCLWAAGPRWSDADLDALRERLPPEVAPITRVAPRLLVARALAHTVPALRAALFAVWRELRPRVFDGRCAQPPRIWAT